MCGSRGPRSTCPWLEMRRLRESPEMNTGVQIKINTTGGREHKSKSQTHTGRKSVTFSDVLAVGFGLTCCFPIGLIVLWTRPWTTAVKIGITVGFFIIALLPHLLNKV